MPYACECKAVPMQSMKVRRELAVSPPHDAFITTVLDGRQKSNTDSSIPACRLVTVPTTLSRFSGIVCVCVCERERERERVSEGIFGL